MHWQLPAPISEYIPLGDKSISDTNLVKNLYFSEVSKTDTLIENKDYEIYHKFIDGAINESGDYVYKFMYVVFPDNITYIRL